MEGDVAAPLGCLRAGWESLLTTSSGPSRLHAGVKAMSETPQSQARTRLWSLSPAAPLCTFQQFPASARLSLQLSCGAVYGPRFTCVGDAGAALRPAPCGNVGTFRTNTAPPHSLQCILKVSSERESSAWSRSGITTDSKGFITATFLGDAATPMGRTLHSVEGRQSQRPPQEEENHCPPTPGCMAPAAALEIGIGLGPKSTELRLFLFIALFLGGKSQPPGSFTVLMGQCPGH